jgi:DNA-binding response OmpR family regulator
MSKDHPTIMVIEDETLLLQAITKKLKLSDMDVLSCASGQQGIDYLKNLDRLPDAVWLDYYLKDMNGLAFMQELKANPAWANIPVLVVSNSASPDKVSNMLALGAKKYILKAEYRLDEIIAMIRDFIAANADDGTDIPAAPTPMTAPAPAPASPAPAAPAATPAASPTPAAEAAEPAEADNTPQEPAQS